MEVFPNKHMKKKLFIVLIGAIFSGCSKNAVPVDIANVCAADNDKKYVSTSGFLDDRGSIFCSNIGGGPVRCMMDVVAKTGDKKALAADIEQGSGSSEIEKLASGYKREDIKIHDNSGAVIKLTDKVTLTGAMSIVPDGSVCFITVDKIEKAQ